MYLTKYPQILRFLSSTLKLIICSVLVKFTLLKRTIYNSPKFLHFKCLIKYKNIETLYFSFKVKHLLKICLNIIFNVR